jgi:vancomycin resistance protein VanJ
MYPIEIRLSTPTAMTGLRGLLGKILAPLNPFAATLPQGRRGWATRAVIVAVWLYLAGVLAFWALVRFTADRWWVGSLLMYGPQWFGLLPLAVLVPLALYFRRRLIWPAMIGLVVLAVPVMGFRVSGFPAGEGDAGAPTIRILTCNCNGGNLDSARLAELVARTRPDIVALQEWTNKNGMEEAWQAEGWHVQSGTELCLATRFSIRQSEDFGYSVLQGKGFATRYELETPWGELHYFNVHLASPRPGLDAFIHQKWRAADTIEANTELRRRESELIRERVDQASGAVLMSGDFNLPSDSAIYRRYWSDLTDSHEAAGWGFGYTWHTRRFGHLRIDHILAGPGWRVRHSEVGPDVNSDHRPVVADVEWVGGATERDQGRSP